MLKFVRKKTVFLAKNRDIFPVTCIFNSVMGEETTLFSPFVRVVQKKNMLLNFVSSEKSRCDMLLMKSTTEVGIISTVDTLDRHIPLISVQAQNIDFFSFIFCTFVRRIESI